MWLDDSVGIDDQGTGAGFPEDANDSMMVGMPTNLGNPAVSLSGIVLGLLLLKVGTESDLLSLDVAEVRVSVVNILNVTLMSIFGIMMFKLAAAGLLRKGIVIPGLNDLAGAI